MKLNYLSVALFSAIFGQTAPTFPGKDRFTLMVHSDDARTNNTQIALLRVDENIVKNFGYITSDHKPGLFTLNATILARDASQYPGDEREAAYIYPTANTPVLEVGQIIPAGTHYWQSGYNFTEQGYLEINGTTDGWQACTDIEGYDQYDYPVASWFENAEDIDHDRCHPIQIRRMILL